MKDSQQKIDTQWLHALGNKDLGRRLFKGQFGLEKENVRVTPEGNLALTPHPAVFGKKGQNPYITTDFSESQVELVTPVLESLDSAYDFLETLHNLVALSLEDEYLWPQSLPPILPEDHEIPIARFEEILGEDLDHESHDTVDERDVYRQALADKYGRKKQMISGIHFNFSLDEAFIEGLRSVVAPDETFRDFKDRVYMKTLRNIMKNSWFLTRLLGSSPAAHPSYLDFCTSCQGSVSIRNGRCGYQNEYDYFVDYESARSYVRSLRKIVGMGNLIHEKEHYAIARPKTTKGGLEAIEETGIEYLELRLVDLNPLHAIGISKADLALIHGFILWNLLLEDQDMDLEAFQESLRNNRNAADGGRASSFVIQEQGRGVPVAQASTRILEDIKELVDLYQPKADQEKTHLTSFVDMIENPETLYANVIGGGLLKEGYVAYHMNLAKAHLEGSRDKAFNVLGHEDMELSTQILILAAMKRGVRVDLLDRSSNFIRLTQGDHVEWVRQATKTSKDTYSSVLAMENKVVTKKILEEAGLSVPRGAVFHDLDTGRQAFRDFQGKAIVVKPNSTNFGLGITIFKESFDQAAYDRALQTAFDHDQTVLVETFAPGKEYRVFVIGDQVVGVLRRVPANVTGDGVHTIGDLIDLKNQSPLRGTGYRKPLQVIQKGEAERVFLGQYQMDFDTVPLDGQVVYLRENSNISTGGDSIDHTDDLSDSLKDVAVQAAKAMGAAITGVDMIIGDLGGGAEDNYVIIELNFNPAIHIHCFPFVGKNRRLGDKLLDFLGF